MMHVSMMYVSMILDPDTCMYDAYIFDLLPLTLMHVCMMRQISSFVYDANPGGSPGRDGAVVVVGLEQAYYEVGIWWTIDNQAAVPLLLIPLPLTYAAW